MNFVHMRKAHLPEQMRVRFGLTLADYGITSSSEMKITL